MTQTQLILTVLADFGNNQILIYMGYEEIWEIVI